MVSNKEMLIYNVFGVLNVGWKPHGGGLWNDGN
jgi:hypothetical protein